MVHALDCATPALPESGNNEGNAEGERDIRAGQMRSLRIVSFCRRVGWLWVATSSLSLGATGLLPICYFHCFLI